jgi:hypothetical protein
MVPQLECERMLRTCRPLTVLCGVFSLTGESISDKATRGAFKNQCVAFGNGYDELL